MASPTGTEIELKLRVEDIAALMRIVIASGAVPAFTAIQRNRYLDTAKRGLDRGRFVLRLREEVAPTTTTMFVTAKGASKKSQDGTLTHVPEEEIIISATEAAAVLAKPSLAIDLLDADADASAVRKAMMATMREAVAGEPVQVVGEFVNERTRIDVDFPEGFRGVLELDRVMFPGGQVHHEVEFEVPHGLDPLVAKRAFEALFARAGVTGKSAPGKAKRFFAAMRGERLP
jgi:uncharacterized protein YjbK